MRPEAGQRFAHFHVYSVLGRGGMGVVFSAYNVTSEQVVALKLLSVDSAGDPETRERFRRESTLARTLSSAHAIPVLDAGEHQGELWLEMPLMAGEDLSAMLHREGTMGLAATLAIIGCVAQALDDAHRIGLIHRDVKPGNIFLVPGTPGQTPSAFLGDFGLTRSLAGTDPELTRLDEVLGTAHYMSPEQAQRLPLGPPTDIYSLACVVFRCLAGEVPFPSPDARAAMFAHIHVESPSLLGRVPGVGPRLDEVLRRSLAKDPAVRPASATALVQQLKRAAEADAVSAEPGPADGPPQRGRRWRRSR